MYIQNEDKDLLFIVTERYQFMVLAYDEAKGEIVTRAGGDAQVHYYCTRANYDAVDFSP
jgi:hypothetical protein